MIYNCLSQGQMMISMPESFYQSSRVFLICKQSTLFLHHTCKSEGKFSYHFYNGKITGKCILNSIFTHAFKFLQVLKNAFIIFYTFLCITIWFVHLHRAGLGSLPWFLSRCWKFCSGQLPQSPPISPWLCPCLSWHTESKKTYWIYQTYCVK